ncbi:MAG: hypothetical protein AAF804_11830, partial [Bacteroidota bacterium]
ISDCNNWEEIEDLGLDQLDWLRGYYPDPSRPQTTSRRNHELTWSAIFADPQKPRMSFFRGCRVGIKPRDGSVAATAKSFSSSYLNISASQHLKL